MDSESPITAAAGAEGVFPDYQNRKRIRETIARPLNIPAGFRSIVRLP